jgi:prepilin-type N-terminal cleavage/methylation domain-containing protein
MPDRRGFTLLEVMIALVVLLLATEIVVKAALETSRAVSLGRRWQAMASAAQSELVRLEQDYRRGRPGCVPPPSGARYTPAGVGLDWAISGDSTTVAVTLEARAAAAGRPLIDTISTTLSCR